MGINGRHRGQGHEGVKFHRRDAPAEICIGERPWSDSSNGVYINFFYINIALFVFFFNISLYFFICYGYSLLKLFFFSFNRRVNLFIMMMSFLFRGKHTKYCSENYFFFMPSDNFTPFKILICYVFI
jgi:hypothetical protein